MEADESIGEALNIKDSGSSVVAFVVLHYLADDLTSACVDSILELSSSSQFFSAAVVIIDNASRNGSLENLKERYTSNNDVAIIENAENIGFSRANNKAFFVAVEKFSPRHIVVLNNDVTIEQADFLDRIEAVYERESGPYIIGPDVYVKRKELHQSPALRSVMHRDDVARELEDLQKQAAAEQRPIRQVVRQTLSRNFFGKWLLKTKRLVGRSISGLSASSISSPDWENAVKNCVLHGSAIVFTDSFLKLHRKPFSPETFLYEEEQILALRCNRNGWESIYTPELQIIHYDDGATERLTNADDAQKVRFHRQHEIASHQILLDYMDGILCD